MSKSIKYLLILGSLMMVQSSVLALNADSDTSGASSIKFEKMEATLSSRIIHFRWSVDAEANGDHFLIEKSLDQENWTAVTRVQSLKNHEEQHTYEISEINFAEGVNEFFRVVRVDQFGEKTELDRVNINRPVLTNILLIPTPRKVNKETTVSYDSMISSRGTIRIVSETGELVYEKSIYVAEGYNRYVIALKDFDSGNYQIVIRDEFDNKISKRLVVYK